MAGVGAAPMFAEWFHALKAGPSTRAKTMGGYEDGHQKHICLQEILQYNCRYVGCPQVKYYPDQEYNTCSNTSAPTSCDNCKQGDFYQ
jgi:hypothetical protein